MSDKWPMFITKDLGDTDEDALEMQRRWVVYNREMQKLIATGAVRCDDDGWWVDNDTGELVGPDPELERPLTDEEIRSMRPAREVFEELGMSMPVGRPPAENPKVAVSIRLDAEIVEAFKKDGPGWQTRINDALREAAHLE